jgi:hypothetical protein
VHKKQEEGREEGVERNKNKDVLGKIKKKEKKERCIRK